MTQLQEKYKKEAMPKLKEKFSITNDMAVPTIEKITVNAGIGKDFTANAAIVDEIIEIISTITGQKPVVINSKDAISNFKLRIGTPNGVKVTLRKDKMWEFLYKLINLTLPRFKDFRGISKKSFDGKGNYTLGVREHTVFPEIDPSKYMKLRSIQVVITTTAKDDETALELLTILGMPFEKERKNLQVDNSVNN